MYFLSDSSSRNGTSQGCRNVCGHVQRSFCVAWLFCDVPHEGTDCFTSSLAHVDRVLSNVGKSVTAKGIFALSVHWPGPGSFYGTEAELWKNHWVVDTIHQGWGVSICLLVGHWIWMAGRGAIAGTGHPGYINVSWLWLIPISQLTPMKLTPEWWVTLMPHSWLLTTCGLHGQWRWGSNSWFFWITVWRTALPNYHYCSAVIVSAHPKFL